MTDQRLIPSHLPLPWLVYPKNGGSQVFHEVLQHRWEEKNIPWLHHFVCMDVNCGWLLLLIYHAHRLSMFQPRTGQKLSVLESKIEIKHETLLPLTEFKHSSSFVGRVTQGGGPNKSSVIQILIQRRTFTKQQTSFFMMEKFTHSLLPILQLQMLRM